MRLVVFFAQMRIFERCRAFSMTAKSMGRHTLFKFISISIVLILALYILIFLLFADPTVTTVTLENAISTLAKEFVENIWFVVVQFLLLLLLVFILGGLVGDLIITKRKNFAVTGGLTILLIWVLLFINCAVTGGVMNSIKYGLNGFTSAVMSWVVFGLFPFLFFGLVHGLALGYFLGRAVKKRGSN